MNAPKVIQPHRCWDGLLGCEQHRPDHDFRFHPHLCLACVDGICMKYNINRSDVGILSLILHEDARLYRGARHDGADKDLIRKMEYGRPQYIHQIVSIIKSAGDDGGHIKSKMKTFRDWFNAQVGIGIEKPIEASAALPVGDR